jgi:hypothetical protein
MRCGTSLGTVNRLKYLVTPWNTVLLKRLTGSQLVKKFPTFYGTQMFITTFTSIQHLFLSWATAIHSMTPHSTAWRSKLVLSSHQRLGLPSGLVSSGLPTKTLHTLLLFPIVLHVPPIFFSILSPERYWVRSTDQPTHSDQTIVWNPGLNSQQVQSIFPFSRMSLPALGDNHPSTLWVSGVVLYTVKLSRTKITLTSLK